MPDKGHRGAVRLHVTKPELDCVVTVGLLRLDLQHDAGTRLDNRHRLDAATLAEYASHSDFRAQ
jgi:hypothetical protein